MPADSCAIASKFLRSRQPLKQRAREHRRKSFCAQAARSVETAPVQPEHGAVITEPRTSRTFPLRETSGWKKKAKTSGTAHTPFFHSSFSLPCYTSFSIPRKHALCVFSGVFAFHSASSISQRDRFGPLFTSGMKKAEGIDSQL